jgi:hypothetical protein
MLANPIDQNRIEAFWVLGLGIVAVPLQHNEGDVW